MFALKGAMKTLDSSPKCKIITEWNPNFLKARGASVDEAVDLIKAKFSIIERVVKAGKVENLEAKQLFNIHHSNLILRN